MTLRRLVAAALLLLASCSGEPGKLLHQRWVLDPWAIARLGVEVPAGSIVELRFDDGTRLSGNAGCNDYGADYDAGNGSLALGDIEVTAMACGDGSLMDLESAYLAAFATVGGWRVGATSDGRPSLTLTGDDDVELRFTAVGETG